MRKSIYCTSGKSGIKSCIRIGRHRPQVHIIKCLANQSINQSIL